MKIEFLVQTPKSPVAGTLGQLIASKLSDGSYDETLVSVAYLTIAGLRALLSAFPPNMDLRSKWLIGLDDWITQPGALDVLLALADSEVKVISYSSVGFRFHPKVYIFQKQSTQQAGFTVLGSANLTASGLAGNGEASATFQIEKAADAVQVDKMWQQLWSQGHKPSQTELAEYRKQYESVKRTKPKQVVVSKKSASGLVILASDDAELDPAKATRCWIECGNITAMGRELELKAEQGIFFGLAPTGGDPRHFSFKVSSGQTVDMRMKYQGNHMWRLQLTNLVPEVAAGLRPTGQNGKLGRSPYVAVIDRTENPTIYALSFIDLKSRKFKMIKQETIEIGTYGKTTARQYGWC